MKGFVGNIEQLTLENTAFRNVLYTAEHSQLVLMSIPAGEDIGEEVHHLDQFIRCEKGEGTAILDGVEHPVADGVAVVIPAGTRHNVVNTGSAPLQLYTLYSPPEHRDGVQHHTKADALADHEHFDGATTE